MRICMKPLGRYCGERWRVTELDLDRAEAHDHLEKVQQIRYECNDGTMTSDTWCLISSRKR